MRKPAVAGTFYEKDPNALRDCLEALWPRPAPLPEAAIAAMVPHAGYIYSGKIAAQVYARLLPADVYVLLGPNHHGRGWPVALAGECLWQTPLGTVEIHQGFMDSFAKACPFARPDERAHEPEHSLEVQLPFLQRIAPSAAVAPILIGTWDTQVLRSVGEALAQAVRASQQRILILASSDMNHFEDLEQTRVLDELALEKVRNLNPTGLIETVVSENISMCGAGAAAAMMHAAKRLGATQVEMVAYGTSADTNHETDSVVGYAGVIVK